MKKNTMKRIAEALSTMPEYATEYAEVNAELAKDEAKAKANREAYAAAREIFKAALTDTPQTIAEIWEKTKTEMEAVGMSKSKVQYAVREYWASDVVKTEGKVNEYRRA